MRLSRESSRGPGLTERTSVRYDAIVVGSGHNGLIAAAYLARAARRFWFWSGGG
jgi:monoamine oxidase